MSSFVQDKETIKFEKKDEMKILFPLTIQTKQVMLKNDQTYSKLFIQKLLTSCEKKEESWACHRSQNLCHILHKKFQSKTNQLLLIPKGEDYEEMAALTLQFCAIPKAQAKRHDQEMTSFEKWTWCKEQVIEHAEKTTHLSSPHQKRWENCTFDEKEHELAYRLNAPPAPSLFPVKVVLLLIQRFRSQYVLDISAGWGDRLLGCCLSNVCYYSRDPNQSMQPCYEKMIQRYGDPKKQKQIVHGCGFEDPSQDEKVPFRGKFDLLLSSPPFFNLEEYSQDENQSIAKYKTLDTWLVEFLWKSLYKCNLWLRPGAHIVLHLCDVTNFKDPSKSVHFVERTLNYCVDVLGWNFVDQWGYAHFHQGSIQMVHHCGNLAKAQPLWIFQKPHSFLTDSSSSSSSSSSLHESKLLPIKPIRC